MKLLTIALFLFSIVFGIGCITLLFAFTSVLPIVCVIVGSAGVLACAIGYIAFGPIPNKFK
jgi:hypothetical protein